MPSAVRQQLLRLVEELPPDPSDADLAPLVQLVSDVAARAPKRASASVKALLRYGGATLESGVRERLAALAVAKSRRMRAFPANSSTESPAPLVGGWYNLARAASRLEIREDTLLRRIDRAENRRRLGYPSWDGYQWKFPSLAVEPETSAMFLARLPEREPLEELLPDWCIREGHSKAPREAKTEEEREALRRRAGHSAPQATRSTDLLEYSTR